MSNYWQQEANRLFGRMPSDPLKTAEHAVRELRNGNPCEAAGLGYLEDIRICLSEYPTSGMFRLGITETELNQWKETYKE